VLLVSSARAEGGTVGDYNRHDGMALHSSPELEGMLVRLGLVARADGRTVGDPIRRDGTAPQCP